MEEQAEKLKHAGGRPSLYTQETADALCAELALGKSLRTVCKAESMPCVTTAFAWMRVYPEFMKQYEKAKEESADLHAEDMMDIADSGSNDWMENNDPDNPGYRANGEHIQRSRLRVDTRKWIASKLKPKKYGDKTVTEVTGKDGKDLVPEVSDTELARRVAFMFAAASKKVQDDSGR
jgi:hypothetical protein